MLILHAVQSKLPMLSNLKIPLACTIPDVRMFHMQKSSGQLYI